MFDNCFKKTMKKSKKFENRTADWLLEVTAKDVYIKQDFANKTAETLGTSGLAQMRHNLYKTNLDTKQLLKDLYKK